ncbi:MAG: hypothetical protein ABEJ42_09475 [Halobacteriaceae archaeon]
MIPGRTGSEAVTCIACGSEVPRSEAREYDKHGDRWDREGKDFEYLCKPCFGELSNGRREGLEALLVEVDAGTVSREQFLERYVNAVEDGRRGGADAGEQ